MTSAANPNDHVLTEADIQLVKDGASKIARISSEGCQEANAILRVLALQTLSPQGSWSEEEIALAEKLHAAFWARQPKPDTTPLNERAPAIQSMWAAIAADAILALTHPANPDAELRALSEALEPFAKAYERFETIPEREQVFIDYGGVYELSMDVEDFCRASVAVNRLREQLRKGEGGN